jgi:hypothetical protein
MVAVTMSMAILEFKMTSYPERVDFETGWEFSLVSG